MTFLEAALEILRRERRPLHFKELTEKATERKLLTFVGRTPEVTMQTQLTAAVKKAPGSPFVRVKPGVFGLLRYPDAAADPEPEAAPEKPQPEKPQPEKAPKGEGRAPAVPAADEGEARAGRRRRRGGRGRRRGRGDAPNETATPTEAAGETAGGGAGPGEGVDDRDVSESPEEPESGSLSAEARAAALAESGVLEGDAEEREGDEPGETGSSGDDSEAGAAPSDADEEEAGSKLAEGEDGRADTFSSPGEATARADRPGASGPSPSPSEGPSQTPTPASEGGPSAPPNQAGRKITSPIDAAIEILKGQAPGRGLHVRQIADAAVRRRLIHGEPNEAWRVMRAALAAEGKERMRAGQRPRVRPAGSGLYALTRRPADSDLERAEFVLGEARRALRERTLAALEQRLGELSPAAFEAVARVLLQREGFGPATFVKRVEGTIYLEALRGRGFKPSRCLIALRPGVAAAGRRALGELRAGIRARNQDEGVLVLAGRLADDAIAEWKQPGAPVEVVDGAAMAESCVRYGIGVLSAVVNVDFVDADFFAEISEG